MNMIDILKNAWKFKVKPLNIVKIYESSIKNNVKILQNIQKKSVLFPVLKSNAYGH
jgi:alanine racemase